MQEKPKLDENDEIEEENEREKAARLKAELLQFQLKKQMKDIPEILKDSFYEEDGPDLAAIETVSSCSCSIDNI